MDRITKSLLDEFCREHGLTNLTEDRQFEHFSAYIALNRFQGETFDTSELVVGEGSDTGIDAIGIIVNGALVTDSETVAELATRNGFLDVAFVFVQAERSPGFDTAKIGQIGFGVSDFFKDQPALARNKRIVAAAATMTEIYQRSGLFKRGNPDCRIFYVTTGKWIGDKNLEGRKAGVVTDLNNLGIFREVEFSPIDADAAAKLYRQTKLAIIREFDFNTRTVIPAIPGVEEAYLGLLPGKEFLNLIQDDEEVLIKTIFFDNVRDWQDYNYVNAGIRETVASSSLRARFALMNNGVTIIAKDLRVTGNRFRIEDYQIVNGCQTSHVIHDQRHHLDDSVMIPVRVIATRNEEVIASIITATNRQTQVKEELLLALKEYQKKLEVYFQTFENGKKLYYERRPCQYNSIPGIEKTRVVVRDSLIRSYAAMILGEPHQTTRRYNEVKKRIGTTIFADNHVLEQYYMTAFASYRLEFLFRNGLLDAKYKPARYQILVTVHYPGSSLGAGRPVR
jgi:hypothetical protein